MNVLVFTLFISVFKVSQGMHCHDFALKPWEILRECYFYLKSDVKLDFEDASSACQNYGGTLPPFYGDIYMEFLVHAPLQSWPGKKKDIAEQIWLGVTNQPQGNNWLQPNGEIANISSETSWWSHNSLNQSTVGEYDCITMNTSTYLWENRDCSEKIAAGMICKIPNTAAGSPIRKGIIIKYLERTVELNGYVYPEILFSRGLSDLEACATHCQIEIKCKAVVWTSNKVCYGYERLISTAEIRIPYPNAMLFNMN